MIIVDLMNILYSKYYKLDAKIFVFKKIKRIIYVNLCLRWKEPSSVSFLYNPSWSENARMLSFCVLSARGLKDKFQT